MTYTWSSTTHWLGCHSLSLRAAPCTKCWVLVCHYFGIGGVSDNNFDIDIFGNGESCRVMAIYGGLFCQPHTSILPFNLILVVHKPFRSFDPVHTCVKPCRFIPCPSHGNTPPISLFLVPSFYNPSISSSLICAIFLVDGWLAIKINCFVMSFSKIHIILFSPRTPHQYSLILWFQISSNGFT